MDVIDTVDETDTSFISTRPEINGEAYVDLEFTKEFALGKYANELEWKRPHVLKYTNGTLQPHNLFHGTSECNNVQ